MAHAIYHAGKPGRPMCGQTGSANGFHVVTLEPKDWNQLKPESRCKKCVDAITKRKQGGDR